MDQVDPVLHPTIRPASNRELLARLDRVFLSAARLELVRPHVLKGETGPRPISVNTMPRIQLMRQCFTLRNPAMEAALRDTPPLRGFAVVGWDGRLPDEITVLRFRHSPEKPRLTKQILAVADATPIFASTPTKNAGSEHAEPRNNEKGEALHFGMKAHIGGDAGYQAARKRRVAEKGATGHGATRRVKRKVLDKTNIVGRHLAQIERSEASVHDKVEHPIRPVKRQVGHDQAGDRDLVKQRKDPSGALMSGWRGATLQELPGSSKSSTQLYWMQMVGPVKRLQPA